MNHERSFRTLWEQQEFEVPNAPDDLCVYGQQFQAWIALLIADVEKTRTLVAVNHGFLNVLNKYFEWRTVVPKQHRNRIGEMGHTCIFHVFEAGYTKLRAIQLSLQPPPLMVQTPIPTLSAPPPPRLAQITGIFLGEEND